MEITAVGQSITGIRKATAKKFWVTKEILQLIDESRTYRNVQRKAAIQQYKSRRNEINRKCREVKAKWLQEKVKKMKKK